MVPNIAIFFDRGTKAGDKEFLWLDRYSQVISDRQRAHGSPDLKASWCLRGGKIGPIVAPLWRLAHRAGLLSRSNKVTDSNHEPIMEVKNHIR